MGFIGYHGVTSSFASLNDEPIFSFTQYELILMIILFWIYLKGRCFDLSRFPVSL